LGAREDPMKRVIIKILIGILSLFLLFIIFLLWGTIKEENKESNLAKTLQVDLNVNREYSSNFPSHYFYLILKPGMSIGEVHNRITNYKKVLNCSNISEVYYYYTSDDDTARRIEIIYDEERRFKELRGEENDSRTIQINGCVEGTLVP
jgi:hypothetical protein